MVGIDLEPDLLISPRDYWEGKARCEDPILEEVLDECLRLQCVPDEEWGDWVLTWDHLEPCLDESILEPFRESTQPFHEGEPLITVEDLEGPERGRGLAWCDRIRVDIEGRSRADVADYGLIGDDIATIDAKGLA